MYYGFGRILLALSLADGKIDKSEIEALERKIARIAIENEVDLDLVLITFEKWKHENTFSVIDMMKGGLHDFHLGDFHLSPKLAELFRSITETIISAEEPITPEERKYANQFLTFLTQREKEQL